MTLVGVLKILLSRDDDEVDQSLQSFFCKMFVVGRAVCFVLAILFTIIAVITNSQNNTRRVPPPKPFFNRDTWVEDFYEGELYYALLKATKYDVIFLMLYAPWDADSQNARLEFETACRYFHKKVYCAAINCWQANARCKAFFDNIVMYPVFLADLHNIPSIKYHGEVIASHMIRFLSTVIKPIERICSVEKFNMLRSTCDALTVSILPDYKWYKKYYKASLRILEYDPRREVCWSFITDKSLATSLNLREASIKLYLWNETKEFDYSFTSKNIIKWIRENVQMMTQWMFFKHARNNRLADLVLQNPAVILFTPRNVYLDYVPTYLLFKEAVMEFKNCFFDMNIEEKRTSLTKQRLKIMEDYEYWERICNVRFSYKASIFNSRIFNIINEKHILTSADELSNVTNIDHVKKFKTVHQIPLPDDGSPLNLVVRHVHEKCRQLNMLKKMYKYSYLHSKSVLHQSDNDVPSALCRLNNTYTFFAVDSLVYSHFATALGLNLNNYKDHTTVVIFDNKNEETFVLTKDFNSKRVLHEFMINSVNHTAPRWMKSTADTSIYLHRYNKSKNFIPNEMAVLELNSESFQTVVFNSSQHVLVYYYSPHCSYCQVSAHAFLFVANSLRNYSHITFARIDSETNDLRWHLVPQSYPTVILFPAGRKAESIVFPSSRELTRVNLLEFVLSKVDAEVKLNYMADECIRLNKTQDSTSATFLQCVQKVKVDCLQVINNLVKRYKEVSSDISLKVNSSITVRTVLNRLKYFKLFYINLDQMSGK